MWVCVAGADESSAEAHLEVCAEGCCPGLCLEVSVIPCPQAHMKVQNPLGPVTENHLGQVSASQLWT